MYTNNEGPVDEVWSVRGFLMTGTGWGLSGNLFKWNGLDGDGNKLSSRSQGWKVVSANKKDLYRSKSIEPAMGREDM